MTTAMVDNSMFNQYSNVCLPCFPPQITGNKKTKDNNNNNHWGTSNHSDKTWSQDIDLQSNGGQKEKYHAHNPWSNIPQQDNNWTSEEFVNSDPLGEESSDTDKYSIDKRDRGSDFDELEIEGIQTPSDGGHLPSGGRLRNDSDAMKDGVSDTHTREVQEEQLEGTLWRGHISHSSMGSSSSVNSVGSSSSWKGGSNNGTMRSNNGSYQRASSPRKHNRYENHRSLSTSGKTMLKYPLKPKKHVMDLDDGIDALHCEPSGWGDLPSPKPSEVDTGTEVWGIPDDIKKKMKKDPKPAIKSFGGNGWVDNSHNDEWGSNNTVNTTTTTTTSGGGGGGWSDQNYTTNNKRPGNNGPSQQWNTGESSWTNLERTASFNDNIKMLVDMKFSISESEDALRRTSNNFEAALGDLLAHVTVKEDDLPIDHTPSNYPHPISRGLQPGRNTNNRLSPSHSRGPSPRTTSPSTVQTTNEQSFQLSSTMGSTPATPTVPVTTQNHLPQMYQQQQQQQSQISRSLSAKHTDTSNIDTQYIQNVLTQKLREHQILKQQLINQMKNPQTLKHQNILTLRLNQVNASILLVNQHLVMTSKLAIQQHKGFTSIDGIDSSNIESPAINKTLSPSDVFGMDGQNSNDVNNLGYSMHNMTVSNAPSTTVSANQQQPSVHSISKLQRIISSGGGDQNMSDVFTNADDHSVFDDDQHGINRVLPTPIGLPGPDYNTINNELSDHSDTITTTTNSSKVQPPLSSSFFTNTTQQQPQQQSSSSPLTSSGKFSRSVDEIPEFKPGVPWNPTPSVSSNQPFPRPRNPSHRSDHSRPDSIPLSTGNSGYTSNDRNYVVESNSEMDYYRDSKSSYGGGNTHIPPPQLYHRTGSSPGMVSGGNPRYTGNNNYTNTPTGGGYYNRPQSVQGYSTRPSPSTPSQIFPPNQFNNSNGGRNRQRLYSQQSGPAGYNDMGQRNRGYDSGRKWSFDSNPWGVPEKSGTSIWSVDSTESLLSPSISSEIAFSPATEWKAPIRKPSLPVTLASPTNCILLKNVPPQIDENSVLEVCSEYGHVQDCKYNTFNSSALIYYRSKEEALHAKIGLDKNPIICGINVQPSFASEKVMATFYNQRTPSHHTYGANRPSATVTTQHMEPSSPWLSSDSLISPSTQQRVPSVSNRSPFSAPMTPSRQDQYLGKKEPTSSVWNRDYSAPGGPTMSNSSSMWGNGSILPGITSPWSTQSNTANMAPERGHDDPSNLIGTSPSMSTYLPNGLF